MKVFIKKCCLETELTDCIVIGVFYPYQLSISANNLNKHSFNYLNNVINLGDIKGNLGDTLLLCAPPNILSKRILLVGCGKKNTIKTIDFKKICQNIMIVLKKTNANNITIALDALIIKNSYKNNLYWVTRLIVFFIKQNLYKISHINVIDHDIDAFQFTLNIQKKDDFEISTVAVKHALAISSGIYAAKNLSNLPPNICTPLYLTQKSKEIAKKYKKNISIDIIDLKKMKSLGMNAYASVGSGSRNPPFMSVIKYTGNHLLNDQIIVLLGKGLTFDSGGISIKPAANLHEMKYDMCGAAAVYGTLITASKLNLPLTIIGILAGCENMLGSNSFRPGDILTTMSGTTVEIKNTDAEGRLVLCDALTYAERFSPNIVIDVATLTGACVTALGESISGLFSNDDILSKELYLASKQTNTYIWRLPLFEEYQKKLSSKVADLSNTGSSKAGAINAACFLNHFVKNYQWAHLDIAGTAWKFNSNKGATGCPVELLSQFLLNQSKFNYA